MRDAKKKREYQKVFSFCIDRRSIRPVDCISMACFVPLSLGKILGRRATLRVETCNMGFGLLTHHTHIDPTELEASINGTALISIDLPYRSHSYSNSVQYYGTTYTHNTVLKEFTKPISAFIYKNYSIQADNYFGYYPAALSTSKEQYKSSSISGTLQNGGTLKMMHDNGYIMSYKNSDGDDYAVGQYDTFRYLIISGNKIIDRITYKITTDCANFAPFTPHANKQGVYICGIEFA